MPSREAEPRRKDGVVTESHRLSADQAAKPPGRVSWD
ncbi:MAG: hypothetical protein QOH42_720 [Blastocatellia bacterium]|nr:hypothetical protein [Blastocatellia bacterium]